MQLVFVYFESSSCMSTKKYVIGSMKQAKLPGMVFLGDNQYNYFLFTLKVARVNNEAKNARHG